MADKTATEMIAELESLTKHPAPVTRWKSPARFYLICERRDDGGLRITSPEIPGLLLSSANPWLVMQDVAPAINAMVAHNGDRK